MQRKILYSYLGELRMILFILIASVCFSILNAQDILFEENFEAASGAENILDNYLGWESGEFDNTTNNNYFWIFDNTRTTVISGSYSMAVSENNPVNSSVRAKIFSSPKLLACLITRVILINAINNNRH